VVVTPDGRAARYLFGLEYSPRDLRFALLEASNGRVGSRVDALLLYCFHYDPTTGSYGVVIMRVLRIFGVLTVLAIASFILVMTRRDRGGAHVAPHHHLPPPSATVQRTAASDGRHPASPR
jgi:protein SCO1/2